MGQLTGHKWMYGVTKDQLCRHFDMHDKGRGVWEVHLRSGSSPAFARSAADEGGRREGWDRDGTRRGGASAARSMPSASNDTRSRADKMPRKQAEPRSVSGPARSRSKNVDRGRRSRSRRRDRSRSRSRRGTKREMSPTRPRSFAERLVGRLRRDDVKGACTVARETLDSNRGLICASGVVARLHAEVDKYIEQERARLLGQVSAVAKVLDADIPQAIVAKLTQEQRLRAEVLARHVARLGERGEALEHIVLQAAAGDSRWHVRGSEFESFLKRARGIFAQGARPAADAMAKVVLGVGGAAGGGRDDSGQPPPESGSDEIRASKWLKRPADLPISDLFWSHDRVSEIFRESGSILETVIGILCGAVDPDTVPLNQVIWHRGTRAWHLLSGNRRLVVWRLASFFDTKLVRVRVQAEKESRQELSEFLTGDRARSHKPKLSTNQNAPGCNGRWVRIGETEEVVGRTLTANTYGCDLLWLLFRSDTPLPTSTLGERNVIRWRPRFVEAFGQCGLPVDELVRRAVHAEGKAVDAKPRSLKKEARESVPPEWESDGYVWLP